MTIYYGIHPFGAINSNALKIGFQTKHFMGKYSIDHPFKDIMKMIYNLL